MVRTAGGAARLAAKDGKWAHVLLPSGELRMVDATAGRLSASWATRNINVRIGKAGRKRHMGRRPHVRGVAQNPSRTRWVVAKAEAAAVAIRAAHGQAGQGLNTAVRTPPTPRLPQEPPRIMSIHQFLSQPLLPVR